MSTNTGGRPKGSKNAISKELVKKAQKGGQMPIDYMLAVMRDKKKSTPEMRLDAARSVAPYLHPKLSSVTVDGKMTLSLEGLTDEQLKLLRELIKTGILGKS